MIISGSVILIIRMVIMVYMMQMIEVLLILDFFRDHEIVF
jgi:hypothetical protein